MDIALSTSSYVRDTELLYAFVVITQYFLFVLSPHREDTFCESTISEITQDTTYVFNKLGFEVPAAENAKYPLLYVKT